MFSQLLKLGANASFAFMYRHDVYNLSIVHYVITSLEYSTQTSYEERYQGD